MLPAELPGTAAGDRTNLEAGMKPVYNEGADGSVPVARSGANDAFAVEETVAGAACAEHRSQRLSPLCTWQGPLVILSILLERMIRRQ
jgi:hypothetical protein